MDFLKKITEFLVKYRYAVLVLVAGLILMLIPASSEETPEPTHDEQEETVDISGQLEEILSQIKGVGSVKVMLTVQTGETTIYQHDESADNRDTVIITDGDRAESGLVQQVIPATYLGAIVVCDGADSAAVRLNVIEAVSKVTGLSADRITVLKMK